MSRNSPLHGDGGYRGFGARKFTFKKVVKLVMRDRTMSRFHDLMENTFREIVREAVDRGLQPFISSLGGSLPSSTSLVERPRFELRFVNSLPPAIYTGASIRAEDGSLIKIELVDTVTNSRVVTGPLSSLRRLEIVPLDGDFTAESWETDEFNRNILRERKGKRPLVSGEQAVTLRDGVGVIDGDVMFTDNSSWTRSRKFRLGVQPVRRDVMEARSEPFVCKDRRGESYEKHHPPLPGDEVWRLEKIAKLGDPAKRLAGKGIRTVKDFLRGLTIDPISIRLIVGGETSNRKWEAIVAHANRCVLDETEFYTYRSLSRGGALLLLNSVYRVVKVSIHGCPFRNVDHLAISEKVFLDELKREAYENTVSNNAHQT
ncbi:PREDICTED: calmodulin-binding protein 60 G [Tarenaya hassleriana]|uniref:calmodulin-binding protein 60 G n=1 Tax=Tarenaya hassleriana TaxID=28532 RepID=UPI00053C9D63|nr:PREDICTED: calmodulin-binding protein 60 G [Tarenaya hassleriana]